MSGKFKKAKIRYRIPLSIHIFEVTCPEYMLAEWKERLMKDGCVIKSIGYENV